MSEDKKKEEPVTKVEEVDSSDEDMPDLEEQDKDESPDMPDLSALGLSKKQAKNEKKSRKAMAKVGMKPVVGIKRAVFKKAKTAKEEHIIFIQNPEVFKSSQGGDVYIIFGEAKLEDISGMTSLTNSSLDSLKNLAPEDDSVPDLVDTTTETKKEAPKTFSANDIELVVNGAKCTEDEAKKALEETGGDVVDAVLRLNPDKKN